MEEEIITRKIKDLLSKSSLVPDAQATTFKKFLAFLDLKTNSEEAAIVNIINGQGIQLRNDVGFLQADSHPVSQPVVPVLNRNHLLDVTDFENLRLKLKELPSEWTVVQISLELDTADVVGLTKEHKNADPTLLITRMHCGEHVDSFPPYCIRVPPPENAVSEINIIERLRELLRLRREYYQNRRNKKIQNVFSTSDSGLASCLNEMEAYWLREWKCLLNGRLADPDLEKQIREKTLKLMEEATSQTCRNKKKCADILFQLVTSAHLLKTKELVKAVKLALYEEKTCGVDSEQLAILLDDIKSLNARHASAVKKAERYPVILIIEPSLELFPWEMTTVLSEQPVSRILSFSLLYALYKHHQPHIHNGYRHLPVNSAYCLLNPDKSLEICEEKIGKFLKKELPWVKVEAGVIPDPDLLISCLSDHRVFMFCGHGSASQYFRLGAIKKALVDGVVLLYGCSSNRPRGRGGRSPYQNDTYCYLTNGCPCLIGALYDITSSDADRACMKTMSSMLSTVSRTQGSLTLKCPSEPDVLRAVLLGKGACTKFWSKCCFVARGLPVRIVFTESEKDEILKHI